MSISKSELDNQIDELEQRAERLKSIVDLAPRAFVVEFAGTPKSGKSTSVEAIRHFFRRKGFRVHVLTERASLCPIPMKGHLFFNTWCATTMLAELLENIETDTDIIIADRGLFDALIWFRLQLERGELSTDEVKHIENFLLMDRWRDLFDLVAVMSASSKTALNREDSQRITRQTGSVMNPPVLNALSRAVEEATNLYKSKFKNFVLKNTDGGHVRLTNAELASEILDVFEEFVNPEIFVVPKSKLEKLLKKSQYSFIEGEQGEMLSAIESSGEFRRRAEVENNDEFIQIVSCGVLIHNGRVFLFYRQDKNPKSSLYGMSTIWQGTHVKKLDNRSPIEMTKLALQRRIAESLFISRKIDSQYVGYTWSDDSAQAMKHLGLIHAVHVKSGDLADSMKKKEFRKTRGYNMTGDFVSISELDKTKDEIDLEPWSRNLLEAIKEEDIQL